MDEMPKRLRLLPKNVSLIGSPTINLGCSDSRIEVWSFGAARNETQTLDPETPKPEIQVANASCARLKERGDLRSEVISNSWV